MPELPKKIEFAEQDRMEAVEDLASRFFHECVGWEFAEVLVTDESDLYDFTSFTDSRAERDAAVIEMLDRAEAHYLIDIRPVGSTRIVTLLEYLRDRGVTG